MIPRDFRSVPRKRGPSRLAVYPQLRVALRLASPCASLQKTASANLLFCYSCGTPHPQAPCFDILAKNRGGTLSNLISPPEIFFLFCSPFWGNSSQCSSLPPLLEKPPGVGVAMSDRLVSGHDFSRATQAWTEELSCASVLHIRPAFARVRRKYRPQVPKPILAHPAPFKQGLLHSAVVMCFQVLCVTRRSWRALSYFGAFPIWQAHFVLLC
jgi:hypothetical protein